ncbi:putative gustatory receptor 28a [Diachasma alloeum]|uniref:Gustatory receptor n=1 Tax=Diachasma alloeum TaxID=454923 RepID=A0A4E0S1B8_9HYME|nr:putative gustatory receptor 28a [Diachasma alloeum]THK33230.1 gustatory receptor 33 [Diachasma alloeum]
MFSKKSLIIFKFIHIVSFLVGLAPYSIKILPRSSKQSGFNFRITYSGLGCAYNILLIFIFTGVTLIITPYLIEWQHFDRSVFMMIVVAVTTLGNIFSTIVIFYYTLHQQQSVAIGSQLSEFDEKFRSKFCNLLKNGSTNRLANVESWLTIFLYLFLWCGVITTSIGIQQSPPSIASFFCALILTSVLMQYSSVIDNLRRRFKNLNEVLQTVFKCPIPSLEGVLLVGNVSNNRLVHNNFTTFKQTRNKLYKISCLIAEFYSFPILLTVFYSFCSIITTCYYFLMTIAQVERFTLDTLTLNTIFWFFLCTYPTVALSRSVRIFNKEMHKTADVIYDVMEMYAPNGEIEYQLTNFAVEQIHKRVEFTACGIFSLDCTLLHSMFGAFVTYLLIMLQFKPKEVMQN